MNTTLELEKIHAEIAHLMAQTKKANTETRWHPWTIIVASVAAGAALAAALGGLGGAA